jgi:uncharacterized protein (DUF433 family)
MADSRVTYVERLPNGAWRVAGTRVSLDSIVHAYWDGRLPEAIAADFPSLTLEQIHGAIAYYLGYRQEIDAYLQEQDARWHEFQQQSEQRHGLLLKGIRALASLPAGS